MDMEDKQQRKLITEEDREQIVLERERRASV